jgi:beta-lactam-binding protein with PASTA domain
MPETLNNIINIQNIVLGIGGSLVAGIIVRLLGQRFEIQIIAALICFIVGFGISHYSIKQNVVATIVVPDVVGSYRAVAERILKEKGFKLATIVKIDSQVDPHKVIQQKPKGGTLVEKGYVVKIVVSKETG